MASFSNRASWRYGDEEGRPERRHQPRAQLSTSVLDIGAAEDGYYMGPVKRTYVGKQDLITSRELLEQMEQFDEMKPNRGAMPISPHTGAYYRPSDEKLNASTQLNNRYHKKHDIEDKLGSLKGGAYAPGKQSPPPYKVGRKPFSKDFYLHSNGDGIDHGTIRFLKRQDIKAPEGAAGKLIERDTTTEDQRKIYPDNWWESENRDKGLLVHKVARDNRWFDNPITGETTAAAPTHAQVAANIHAVSGETRDRTLLRGATRGGPKNTNPIYHVPFLEEAMGSSEAPEKSRALNPNLKYPEHRALDGNRLRRPTQRFQKTTGLLAWDDGAKN